MSIKKIVLEAIQKNPVGLKEALQEELSSRVSDKLDEAREQLSDDLNEISKDTLSSYIKKAVDNHGFANRWIGRSGNTDKDAKLAAINRQKGIKTAVDKLTKEDVNEQFARGHIISVPGAEKNGRPTSHLAVHLGNKAVYLDDKGDVEHVPDSALSKAEMVSRPSAKHKSLARKYLENMKEDTEVNEVSKKTLGSYIKKASDDLSHIQRAIGSVSFASPDYKSLSKSRKNRKAGISNAVDKLTKEDLNEATGMKDGYYVTDKNNEITHDKIFQDSKYAISHANKLENKTGYVHRVHKVKDGKIDKQWEYNGGKFDAGWEHFSDFKGEPAHQHMRKIPKDFIKESELDESKEVTMTQLQKKFNDGTHEAMHDPKPGKHVELRNTKTGKRETYYVKE